MANNKLSPFSQGLLSNAPTQQKMRSAAQELDKLKAMQNKDQAKQDKARLSEQKQDERVAALAVMKRPFWWVLLMFVCAVAYLFPEAVFNAALTDVAGSRGDDGDTLKAVELFGRTISGIGVTLLLADMLLKGRVFISPFKALSCFTLIALIVWPTVFFGQKLLVDHYLIDASSGQQRQQAYLSQLMRRALIENSVIIEGVDYDPNLEHSSTEKTFLSIFGGLVYADNNVIESLAQNKHKIVAKFVGDYAMSNFDQYYTTYQQSRESLRNNYREYVTASHQYNEALASAPERSKQYWLATQNEIKQGWSKYQKATSAYEARVEARAQKIAPKIYDYFERRERCTKKSSDSSKKRCYERLDKGYDREIKKYDIPYIPPDAWLKREEISTASNIGTSIVAGVLTGGIYTALQAANAVMGGDGGFKDHRMVYTNDVNHYKNVLLIKMAPRFRKESGGYALGITTLNDFRFDAVTAQKVRKSLKAKGLALSNDWQLRQRGEFDRAVTRQVKHQTTTKWRTKMKARGLDIAPNMAWGKFQLLPGVQQRFRQSMNELYVSPMLADWNNIQFKQRVIDINIKRKTSEYLKVLAAQTKEFADGGSLASTGKEALRAIMVPPISMAISLMLVLLTVFKLPFKVIELIKAKRAVISPQSASNRLIQAAVPVVIMLAIIVLPLSFGSNKFTQPGSSLNYFFTEMEKNDSVVTSLALKWLLTTQPLVQPIGSAIDSTLQISRAFSYISEPLENFEQRMTPRQPSIMSKVKESSALLPLTINTNVANAKISIMNIKPKYKAGIMLPSGGYDIKVSKANHQAVRKWVYLKPAQLTFKIDLK